MLQLEELKGKLPAYRVSLKEAGESLRPGRAEGEDRRTQ